jgi:DNA repair exonuclease SbcCD ATPase subunit
MQTKAMESIMNMLQKEEQRRQQLQASLEKEEQQGRHLQTTLAKTEEQLKAEAQKKAAAEQAAAQLREQIKALQADLRKAAAATAPAQD